MEDTVITLSPGLDFVIGDQSAWIEEYGIPVDAHDVTPVQAAFLLADLNRWILLSVEAAGVWFASAIRRARKSAAARPAPLAAE